MYEHATGDLRELVDRVMTENTVVVKRGIIVSFRVLVGAGATFVDVTQDDKLRIMVSPAQSCFQVTRDAVAAFPQANCEEIIEAAGGALGSFGFVYVDDANKIFAYDLFDIRVTK